MCLMESFFLRWASRANFSAPGMFGKTRIAPSAFVTSPGTAMPTPMVEVGMSKEGVAAAALGAFVRIDMEEHSKTDRTLAIWRELRPINPETGVVIQAALRRSGADIEALIAEGARVRLCKGAYNEPASVAFRAREEVDAAYETLARRLLRDGAHPALATHDGRLIGRLLRFVDAEGIPPERYEFQMLFGVRRDLQAELLRRGQRVRVYVPYGTEWYPYFMRRLAEKPANVTFLLRSLLKEGRGPAA